MLTKCIIVKDGIRGEIIKVKKLTKNAAFARAWQIAKDRCHAYDFQGKPAIIKVNGKTISIERTDIKKE